MATSRSKSAKSKQVAKKKGGKKKAASKTGIPSRHAEGGETHQIAGSGTPTLTT